MKTMKAISALVLVIAVAGCDALAGPEGDMRAGAPVIQATSVIEGSFHLDAIITCNVTVATAAVACTSPQDTAVSLPPTIGGRGVHARLIRKSAAYVPDSSRFRVSMQVKNLLYQMIGTRDGGGTITGVKAFFYQLPVTTVGTGTVTIANSDGAAEFTAPNQPYFEYPVFIKSEKISPPKSWVFNVPATVTRFRFRIAISASILPIVAFDMEGPDGNRDIYRVNLDGSQLIRLTANPSVEMSPTVAQDRIVFVTYRDGNANLFSMSLAGGPQTRLTNTGWNETEPSLSSDGTRLAYLSDQTGYPRMMHAAGNATNPQPVTPFGFNGNIPSSPTWVTTASTPLLAYASSAKGPVDIFMTNLSNGSTYPVLTTGTGPNVEPKFNAAGTKMTFVLPVAATPTNTEVWIHDVATDSRNSRTRLTNRVPGDIQPTFAHDGRVVWLSEAPDGSYTLRWMSDDGVTKVNVGAFAGQPWNPFGVPLQ
jgi:hypothetical protein